METKIWNDSQPERYPLLLGKLFANIATLEFGLRAILYQQKVPAEKQSPVATPFTSLRPGEVLDESPLTSWDSFGQLLTEYNRLNPKARIPPGLKDIRDAFAHGRILAANPEMPLSLVRFSRPKHGKVHVEMAELLTAEWLGAQVKLVHDAAKIVHGQLHGQAAAT